MARSTLSLTRFHASLVASLARSQVSFDSPLVRSQSRDRSGSTSSKRRPGYFEYESQPYWYAGRYSSYVEPLAYGRPEKLSRQYASSRVGSICSAMPLPARPPTTAPTAAPTAVPTGPATVPAAAPAAMPPAPAPAAVPTGWEPGAPVNGSRLALVPVVGRLVVSLAMMSPEIKNKSAALAALRDQRARPRRKRMTH